MLCGSPVGGRRDGEGAALRPLLAVVRHEAAPSLLANVRPADGKVRSEKKQACFPKELRPRKDACPAMAGAPCAGQSGPVVVTVHRRPQGLWRLTI